jgi:DnaK suppressor protein
MPNKGDIMNQKEKERMKTKLAEERQELIEQLSEFRSNSRELEPEIAQDVGDKAESSYTKEFLLHLSEGERERLFQIDEALKKIEKSNYGTCDNCGQPISKKRLNAIPWTPYCIKCKEKQEQESP